MKLSASQIIWIIATVEIVMIIHLIISPTVEIAKQDAWISILVGSVGGAALTFFIVHLSLLHPNQTLVEFSQTLLGKWLGRMIVLPYFVAWYTLSVTVLRQFGEFYHLILLDRTPLWVILFIITGVAIYLSYNGITGIGRFSGIAGPVLYLVLIIIFILGLGNLKWIRLLPVYSDSGWVTILKGALPHASFLAESFMLLVIVSFMHNPQKAPSRSILGISIVSFITVITTIMVITVFGPNFSVKLRTPSFMFMRTIDILDFIQNIDVFIIILFIFGAIAKLSLYLFITSYELANWFKMKNWRSIIWFGAPAIFIMALLIPDKPSIDDLYLKFWEYVIFPICGIGIPLLLWIISVVKKKPVKL
ncbi:MAG: spore germination protein [Paenibacillus sp.]|jgi:spore germination protein KB|nr:spore germination protein [Paenibacillus sp.]